ncbi:hypothetical protein GCM10011584_33810 [Nocardioides phosphati]|uniref:ER-bound oxygenase mpaB/mpaB'/Rubber oxygenase catalytic domain-containing protein n=1 Tax=Nocardioides phosphati TaxID=1867775 RepID=A0ABQ2NDL6_9ACTN|nr:oxygenase MpaB family protein [Nocardioides phosphati]GGO93940.1 hypothetical protein GCM10011584_33810 [Nocardioides phosphati]
MGAEARRNELATHDGAGQTEAERALTGDAAAAERELLGRLDGLGVFLAGSANVVMQLSRPAVGYGVMESKVHSGQVQRHPFKRFRTTIGFLDIALNGSPALQADYREAINRQHRQVRSGPDSPVRYNAFDRDLQKWVASCLYYGVRDVYLTMRGPLTPAEEEVLLRACSRFGTMLQMPGEIWHADRATFVAYWDEAMTRIAIDPALRDYLLLLLRARFLPFPLRLFGPSLTWTNTGFLPAPLRDALDLRWSAADERWFRRLTRTLGRAVRYLPGPLRRAPMNLMAADLRLRRRLGRPMT